MSNKTIVSLRKWPMCDSILVNVPKHYVFKLVKGLLRPNLVCNELITPSILCRCSQPLVTICGIKIAKNKVNICERCFAFTYTLLNAGRRFILLINKVMFCNFIVYAHVYNSIRMLTPRIFRVELYWTLAFSGYD